MTKVAHILTSLMFAFVCGALWFIWKIAEKFMEIHVEGLAMFPLTDIALPIAQWIFVLPIPAVIYSAVLMDRVDLSIEKVVLYFVIVSFISVSLVLATAIIFGSEAIFIRGVPLGGA